MKFPLVLAVASISLAVPAFGLQPTQPATAPTASPATTRTIDPNLPTEGLVAVVQAVEGKVQIRKSKDAPWEPAVVGMELREGSEIRTGLRSAIRCTIPPDQTFVLDRLGTIELTQAIRQGNFVKTDLTMKYGRAQYEIQKAGLDHDAAITSPGATLAVRGTIVELEDTAPFRPRAISYTGRARFSSDNRTRSLGGPGSSVASLESGRSSAADTALLRTVIDPQFKPAARSASDNRLIANQTSLGAVARFDTQAGIPVIFGGPGPVRLESQLVPSLPGDLSFVARWSNDVDVNMTVFRDRRDPNVTTLQGALFRADERLFPGFGFNTTPSGGRIDFDHRGGPNGGQEIAYYNGVPGGTYNLLVSLDRGQSTDVTINVFARGVKQPLFANLFGESGGPGVTPPLTANTFPLDPSDPNSETITFRSGKSTTFTFSLQNVSGSKTMVANIFIPLNPDNIIAQDPDLNNGAPANLPTTGSESPAASAALRAAAATTVAPAAAQTPARPATAPPRQGRFVPGLNAAPTPKTGPIRKP